MTSAPAYAALAGILFAKDRGFPDDATRNDGSASRKAKRMTPVVDGKKRKPPPMGKGVKRGHFIKPNLSGGGVRCGGVPTWTP